MTETTHSVHCAANGKPKGPWKGHRWHKTTLRQRLDEKIRVTPSCWIWLAAFHQNGYGGVKVNQVQMKAHRAVYETYVGAIPEGLVLMHKCDNKWCVNPDHLTPGTMADNNLDRDKKGRSRSLKGQEAPWSKLTEAQAQAIKKDRRPGSVIAAEFGVSRHHIYDLRAGRRWKHLG